MKFRLPCSLLFLLTATLTTVARAEQPTISTWDELSDALAEGKYELNLNLADVVFEVSSIDYSKGNEQVLPKFFGNYTFTGVSGKTIFRGADFEGTNKTNRPFFYGGGGILTMENCSFENFRTNITTNDKSSSNNSGGAIGGGGGGGVFKSVVFRNNGIEIISTYTGTYSSISASSGAFGFADRRVEIGNITECSFIGNYVKTSSETGSASSTGGAILLSISQSSVQGCLFEGNYAEAQGTTATATSGAMYSYSSQTDCVFRGNHVRAIATGSQESSYAEAFGGAIGYTNSAYYYDSSNYGPIKNCLFELNYASAEGLSPDIAARGGAVYGNPGLQDCDFYYNYTTAATKSQGGAVFAKGSYGDGMQGCLLFVSAIEKDSVFRHNRMGVTQVDPATGKPLDGIANAIYSYSDYDEYAGMTNADSIINFRAKKGKSVLFYDPIVLQMGTIETRPCTQVLEMNKPDADGIYEGSIVFTGEDFASTDNPENWTSRIYYNMDMRLYAGSLVIRDKAIFGAPYIVDDSTPLPEDGSYDREIGPKSFTMDQGVLEITGKGHLLAREVTINGGHELSTFRTGTGAMLTARTIDLSQGVSFDFSPFLDNHDSGLFLSAPSVTLGGVMGISDTLDYYTDKRWAANQEYMALAFTPEGAESLEGSDFTDIMTHATGSSSVQSPYTYEGYWSKVWKDSDGDGVMDQLYAVWTPTGGIQKVQPELAGDDVLNSLWSTVSNMGALSDAAMGQIGPNRYKLEQCANYWVQGIGDFDMHRSARGRDGYDYNGFGYAVGADTRLCPKNWLVGVAFGNFYGKNKSRDFSSEIKQTTYIGMIYGGYYKEYNSTNALNVTASASMGQTRNKLRSFYRDGERSTGKWNNRAERYTLEGQWSHALNENWTLNPFLGLEYDDARTKSFTESGDKARAFGKGTLRNLALPVGSGIGRTDRFQNGRIWINGLELSYVPDIYRKNPESPAERLSNGFRWIARSVEPSRHAGRASCTTRVIWNKTWSTFAGYEIEWRKNAVYQEASLGCSASF